MMNPDEDQENNNPNENEPTPSTPAKPSGEIVKPWEEKDGSKK